MNLIAEHVAAFRRDFAEYADLDHRKICDIFNAPLYAAFAANRRQMNQPNTMKALFLLLDKAYSAGLRRSYRDSLLSNAGTAPVDAIVDRLCTDYASEYAEVLREADQLGKTLRQDNVPLIGVLVDRLCALLTEAGGGKKRPLSFSSKFLHFYTGGIVPIWDSYARAGLCALTNRKAFPYLYGTYAHLFGDLCHDLFGGRQFKPHDVKLLDNCLIWRASE